MKIGFTCGAFDLVHFGHIRMLAECRSKCDFLIVAVQGDPSIDRPNTKVPCVQSLEQRMEFMAAIRYVDNVCSYDTEADLVKLLARLNEEYDDLVRFVGADWQGKPFTGHELPIEVVFNSRSHTFSSTAFRRALVKHEMNRCSDDGVNNV